MYDQVFARRLAEAGVEGAHVAVPEDDLAGTVVNIQVNETEAIVTLVEDAIDGVTSNADLSKVRFADSEFEAGRQLVYEDNSGVPVPFNPEAHQFEMAKAEAVTKIYLVGKRNAVKVEGPIDKIRETVEQAEPFRFAGPFVLVDRGGYITDQTALFSPEHITSLAA